MLGGTWRRRAVRARVSTNAVAGAAGARTVVAEETGNAATQADEDEQRQPRVRDAEPGCGRPYRK